MNDVDNSTTIYHRTFSVRNSKLLFLDFGYTHWGSITVITTGGLCPCSMKTVQTNTETNGYAFSPIKIYLQKQIVDWIGSSSHCSPVPGTIICYC